jgi:hypothetical protein
MRQISFLRGAQRYAKSRVMPTDPTVLGPPAKHGGEAQSAEKRSLTPAAQRALAEAAALRAERDKARSADAPKESGGRGGLDPTRYGDWEINGLISDF